MGKKMLTTCLFSVTVRTFWLANNLQRTDFSFIYENPPANAKTWWQLPPRALGVPWYGGGWHIWKPMKEINRVELFYQRLPPWQLKLLLGEGLNEGGVNMFWLPLKFFFIFMHLHYITFRYELLARGGDSNHNTNLWKLLPPPVWNWLLDVFYLGITIQNVFV